MPRVAVGDAYALAMTLLARTPTVFVGTAKSVDVAPYGRFEERVLARASARFVRDDATAAMLRRHGVRAEAANAIVDLVAARDDPNAAAVVDGFETALALFPGSRESAYDDAAFLLAVTRELARERRGTRRGALGRAGPGCRAICRRCARERLERGPGAASVDSVYAGLRWPRDRTRLGWPVRTASAARDADIGSSRHRQRSGRRGRRAHRGVRARARPKDAMVPPSPARASPRRARRGAGTVARGGFRRSARFWTTSRAAGI